MHWPALLKRFVERMGLEGTKFDVPLPPQTKHVMLFNSIQFAIFLPIVFLLYWFAFDRFISKSKWQLRLQNAFVVVASYVFYGWWDWRFLLLIAFTSFCSWGSGMLMQRVEIQQFDPKLTGGVIR